MVFYKNIPQALESLPKESKHFPSDFSNARLSDLPKKEKFHLDVKVLSHKNNAHIPAKITILLEHSVT